MNEPQKSKLLTIVHIALVLLGFYLLWSFSSSIYSLWKRGDIVGDREKHLLQLEKEQDELKTQLSYTLRPEFIEEEARNKLNMILPGETMVIVPDSSSSADIVQQKSVLESSIDSAIQHDSKRIMHEWIELFVGS